MLATRPRPSRKKTAAPAAKRKRLSPEERERLIVREAVQFFAEHGFEGQTRELARRCGITQPLLYRYFPNKQALIDRVYREVFLSRWDPHWEQLLDDRTQPIDRRLKTYYREYARAILSYEWIRIFLFSGLKGVDINSRYLKLLHDRVFPRVIREVRAASGLPGPDAAPIAKVEFELIWALHAAIFYIGVRRWIYRLPIPEDLDTIIDAQVAAFLEGVPRAMEGIVGGPRLRAAGTR
jgi:AcrR family transcriptional regulator